MEVKQSLHRKDFDRTAKGPLDGVRVVDLSRLVAGNMLSKVLADFGAEVIKVEPPNGDTLRGWRVEGVQTAWKTWCRNKKSICLDLRSEEGREAVRKLSETADIFIESFRPGVLEQMGLAPSTLQARNGKLIVVRISGWGQTGPYRTRPGFGTLIEGYSGFAASNGFGDREPVLPPMFLGDAVAGLYGTSAVMIALRSVECSNGVGQVIDLSLFDPMMAVLEPQVANYRLTRKVKPRTGSRSTNTAPRNTYKTLDDRWVCLSSATQSMAEKLFHCIDRSDLISDPRFATNAQRLKNIEVLDGIIADYIAERPIDEVLSHFEKGGVTIGPIMDAASLYEDVLVRERESLIEVPDGDLGWLPMHGEVPRLSETPSVLARPAPRLGEHNEEILLPILGDALFNAWMDAGIVVRGEV